jgi:arabinofuranosyltransferase
MARKIPWTYLVLALIGAAFVAHALSLSFTQDDSYISYRYVKNFLDGNGLVFNPGEYVEGYTNFFFVILLAFFGKLGLDYIAISKIIGIISGLSVIGVAYFGGRKFLGENVPAVLLLFVPAVLAANPAFAYWSISGMETTLYAAFLIWGLLLAAEKRPFFVPLLALATMTRPEAALVYMVVLIYFLFIAKSPIRNIILYLLIYALLTAPSALFRLYYYHDILPNTFYAKTGMSLAYFRAGLKYVFLFMQMYGFYGLILILPAVAYKWLTAPFRFLFLISIFYLFYIIAVGGDVLHEHRFFVPLLAPYYLVFAAAIFAVIEQAPFLKANFKRFVPGVIFILAIFMTLTIPRGEMQISREAMRNLVNRMRVTAETLNQAMGGRFLLSCSTIGAISYYSNAGVIDMIGLTDRTIAKEPQREVPGIVSDWKERQYNVPYLMQRQPDFILFSTGLKPTAPAERALFLSTKFRQGYYPVMLTSPPLSIYKRKPGYVGKDSFGGDPRFINFYVEAVNYYLRGEYDSAAALATLSLAAAPPDFYPAMSLMGDIDLARGKFEVALPEMQKAFDESGGYAIETADKLAMMYQAAGDSEHAAYYRKVVEIQNRLK